MNMNQQSVYPFGQIHNITPNGNQQPHSVPFNNSFQQADRAFQGAPNPAPPPTNSFNPFPQPGSFPINSQAPRIQSNFASTNTSPATFFTGNSFQSPAINQTSTGATQKFNSSGNQFQAFPQQNWNQTQVQRVGLPSIAPEQRPFGYQAFPSNPPISGNPMQPNQIYQHGPEKNATNNLPYKMPQDAYSNGNQGNTMYANGFNNSAKSPEECRYGVDTARNLGMGNFPKKQEMGPALPNPPAQSPFPPFQFNSQPSAPAYAGTNPQLQIPKFALQASGPQNNTGIKPQENPATGFQVPFTNSISIRPQQDIQRIDATEFKPQQPLQYSTPSYTLPSFMQPSAQFAGPSNGNVAIQNNNLQNPQISNLAHANNLLVQPQASFSLLDPSKKLATEFQQNPTVKSNNEYIAECSQYYKSPMGLKPYEPVKPDYLDPHGIKNFLKRA